jgi:ABC-type methionine transport system permease subunit
VWRVLGGFAIAAAIGVPLGIMMGAYKPVEAFFEPFVSFARYLPASAFIPLLILWAGIGENSKLALIFIGSFFQLVLMVAVIVGTTRRDLVEAAYTLGASQSGIVRRVLLPASAPQIAEALRLVLGWAWTYVIVAEFIGAERGIGKLSLPPAHSPWNAHYLASKAGEGHAFAPSDARGARLPEVVGWFEPHALPELPRFVRAARYLLPVQHAGWLRAELYWDRSAQRERIVLEGLDTKSDANPLRAVHVQALVDRLPLQPAGATRSAWNTTAAEFASGRGGRALILAADEANEADAETLRLLEVTAA